MLFHDRCGHSCLTRLIEPSDTLMFVVHLQATEKQTLQFLFAWNLSRYATRGVLYASKPSVSIAQSKSSALIVFRFSRWHLSLALCIQIRCSCKTTNVTHSLVMKLMNSETHSCTVSFASFATCKRLSDIGDVLWSLLPLRFLEARVS